jgi:hypothetical protein
VRTEKLAQGVVEVLVEQDFHLTTLFALRMGEFDQAFNLRAVDSRERTALN